MGNTQIPATVRSTIPSISQISTTMACLRTFALLLVAVASLAAISEAGLICPTFPSCCVTNSCGSLCPSCPAGSYPIGVKVIYPKYADPCSINGNPINFDPFINPGLFPINPNCIWVNRNSNPWGLCTWTVKFGIAQYLSWRAIASWSWLWLRLVVAEYVWSILSCFRSIGYLGRLHQSGSFKNTQLLKIFSFDIQRSSLIGLTSHWCSVSWENNFSGIIGLLLYIGVSLSPLDPRSYSWEPYFPSIGCLEDLQNQGKNHWLSPGW